MARATRRDRDLVPLGYVSGAHGVSGWVKVHSWTDPREAILEYAPWLIGEGMQETQVRDGRLQGQTVVAALEGVSDRDKALALRGSEIAVPRERLPRLEGAHWYWSDLLGLAVQNESGEDFGRIDRMLETGAHDVMVVVGDRERLIPFVPGVYVVSVDIEGGRVVVDWQSDYLG